MNPKKLSVRVYTLSYSRPKDDKGYRQHGTLRVLARDLQDAIYTLEKEIPDASIWSCAHQGAISMFSDAALVSLCMETDRAVLGMLIESVAEKESESADDGH